MAQRMNYRSLSKHFAIGVVFGAWAVSPQAVTEAVIDLVAPSAAYAQETDEVSPTTVRDRPRDVYYPNTEDLAEDEMRVIACGTGMPTTRAAQAAACFLVELGNGDKFLFDIGSGSAERISSLQIPYNYLDKVFIGHLHTDHFGALHDLFIGGALMGRNVPLRVWGPSGPVEELGTAYALENMRRMLTWDLAARAGNTDFRGYSLEINEFDYKGENQVVYENNGVTIRSFPAIHAIDGSVSYALEWNGLKFVFSSDTYPNKWFKEYAKNADLAIHECFIAVPELVSKMKFTPESALLVGTQVHTAPEAFGKVMSDIQPRLAVAYHFFNDFDTVNSVYQRIRSTYDGPLSLADDFMVWNVTKDDITIRMAATEERTWAPPLAAPAQAPDMQDRVNFSEKAGVPQDVLTFSEFTLGGVDDVDDVLRPIYEEASEVLGKDFPYPGDD
ncbi:MULTISPECIES: guanitoxin biosynthesis MBL fold metallo-hydrolase GntH [unclassified Ruegeria]|uniref:guanitoxin biosynthesis MBL fold metallo-hydrolase GntH n=1 Tax=unclassified Ruegeria TaxID=2625375 RepID=UPI00148A0CFD|nr:MULTISPECIES: guanitoxin biosynthesis MBL fold metallo-hydrolase GntH [unclassified Ruegeria]NOD65869.1 MBL fold metallo-hydrolase [Ruegeria sp. HKCCD6109]